MNTYKQLTENQDNFSRISQINYTEILSYNDSSPLVTIGIPTYNRAHLLKQAVESSLNQRTDIKFEILIVDNNPKRNDETEQTMLTFSNHTNISYYKNEENIGLVGNWNRIYQLAKGTWVVMLHDDDLLFYDYLETMFTQVIPQIGKENVAIVPNYKTQEGKEILLNKVYRNKIRIKALKITENDFCWKNIIGAPVGLCLRKDIMLKFGGFSYENFPNMDRLFFFRYAQKYPMYKLQGYPLAIYRILNNSCTRTEVLRQTIENHINFITILLSNKNSLKKKIYSILLQHTSIKILKGWSKTFKLEIDIPEEMKRLNLKELNIIKKTLSRCLEKYFQLNIKIRTKNLY